MKPVKSFEWNITQHCNYKCEYCLGNQNKKRPRKHCSDKIIDAVFQFMEKQNDSWLIKIYADGEPMLHPRFFDIVTKLITCGHKFCMTTNFSLPIELFQKLVKICGANFTYMVVSLHLSQIKDKSVFLDKAKKFAACKNVDTDFRIAAVVTDDNFEETQKIHREIEGMGIKFTYAPLKVNNKYIEYSNPSIETYIKEKGIANINKIRNRKVFGTICYTGFSFFYIDIDGYVFRCYNLQPYYVLGNILDRNFALYKTPKPCMATRCTCTLPVNRGMIKFGEKAGVGQIIMNYFKGLVYSLPKAIPVIFNELKRRVY